MAKDGKRLQINLSENSLKELEDLKQQIDESTYGGTVKASLKIMRFLQSEVSKGNQVVIRDKKTGKERQLII